MLTLEPVEHDPFGTVDTSKTTVEPVDFNPFEHPDAAKSVPRETAPEPTHDAMGTPLPSAAPAPPPVEEPPKPAADLNQFERGVMTGVVGAKQMGAAASTIPSYVALREYSRVRGLFDQIDAGGYQPKPPRIDDRYGDTLARRYFTQPGEREALRQRLDDNSLSAQATRDELLQAWKAYEDEIKQYEGRTPNFTDIRDAKGFGDWFAYNTGQSLPYLAITALSSLAGGVVAGPGGAAGGLLASGYGIGVGDIQSELIEKGQGEQYGNAMAGAVPYAALDFLGPVGRAFRTISGNTLRDVATGYFRRLGREIPENAIEEFVNEAGQEIVKDAAVTSATGEAMLTDEALLRWFNAGMAGAAGGVSTAPVSAIPGPTRAQQAAQANTQSQPAAGLAAAPAPVASQPAQGAPQPATAPAGATILQPQPAAAPAPMPNRDSLAASLADPRPLAEIDAARQAEEAAAAQVVTDRYGLPAAGPVTVRFPDGEEFQGEVIGAVEQDGQGFARIRDADGQVYLLSKDDADIAVAEGTGVRTDPVKVKQAADVDAAAKQANQAPTDAQKEAGNYQKGHLKLQGLDISIENPAGSTRSGIAPDGSPWSVQMPTHYGYIKRTTGADGDQVDVYIGPNPESDWVWVVDQIDPATGKFDEHKVMLGYSMGAQAGQHYLDAFSDGSGRQRAGAETRMTMAEFKDWLSNGDASKPLAYVEPAPQPVATLEPVEGDPFAAEAPPRAPAAPAASTGAAEPQPAAAPVREQPAGAPSSLDALKVTEMTDQQLAEATQAYGPGHKRQKAVAREIQRRQKAISKEREDAYNRGATGDQINNIDQREAVLTQGAVDKPDEKSGSVAEQPAQPITTTEPVEGDPFAAKPPLIDQIADEVLRVDREQGREAANKRGSELIAEHKITTSQLAVLKDKIRAGVESAATAQQNRDSVPAEESQDAGRTEPLGGASDQALEAVPAEPVRAPEGQRETGERGALGGGDDARGDAAAPEPGGDAGRGVAGDEGTVPVPARGAGPAERADAGERRAERKPGDGKSRPQPGLTQAAPEPDQDTGKEINEAINDPEAQRAGKSSVPGFIAPVATNYVITDKDRLGEGGQAEKFRDNIAAIRLLKQLEADGRRASAEEQAVLVRYVGWGGIKSAFPKSDGSYNKGWEAKGRELRELLTDDEYNAAMRSVLDAHYTAPEVVTAIHAIIAQLGYRGGKLLEPSMGTGNFFGLMPLDLRSQSEITGVELDRITGGIAKQLYQTFNVLAPVGFQDAPLADNYFDVAVGNPPFGIQRVPGAKEKDIKTFSIHNYFFARTINKLRPGGIMAMVITHRFLDKPGEAQRQYIAERAKFIGAIRLPNTAFQQNALTEVTTDIVIFQKLAEGEKASNSTWTQVGEVKDPLGGDPMPLNRYFIDNPDMMLGRMERSGTMRQANEPTLAPDGRNLSAALTEAIAKLPVDVFTPSSTVNSTADMVKATGELSEAAAQYDIGAFYLDGDQLQRREESPDGSARAITITPATQWSEKQTLGEGRFARLKGMVEVRDAARRLLRLEAGNATDQQLTRARKSLNDIYDKFTGRHGFLNERANEGLFKDDPDAPLLLALEKDFDPGISADRAKKLGVKARKPTAQKMAIFKQRVITHYQPVTRADSPKDALVVSLADLGRVDIGHMAKLTGKPESDIVKALHDDLKEPLIFRDPVTNTWETASYYLSGNVKAKAKAAQDAGLVKNVDALRAVFPPDKKSGDIKVRLGAPWVGGRYYGDFAKHLFGDGTRATVVYIPVTGGYAVEVRAGNDTKADATWGTSRMDGVEILDRILNAKDLSVYDKVEIAGEERRVVNKDATIAVQEKADAIRQEFDDWIMRDADRRTALTDYFNENINTTIAPRFDGSHLTLPGKVPDSIIKFRRHQRDATWRGIQQRTVLFDHVVGAGKTFTAIATAMELRRMGLAKKPMVVVPNHLVEQWAADFYRLYPGAKILTMTKKDFEARNRRRMLSRIATGDWDAVVIAHSSFGFIRINAELEAKFIEHQMQEIQDSIDILRQEAGKGSRRVADLVRSKERLSVKLKDLADKPKDDILTFDELGVDQLLVDEAHEFKNLYFTTGRRGMLGLGNPQGSKKAFDMFIKTQYLLTKQDGRGVIFATGTPVSNSLTEMYTVQRYLGLPALERLNIRSFDAWLNTFGVDATDYELDGSGVKLKQVSRLRRLTNMNQLMPMYQQYADSVTIEQIQQAYREENPGKEFPIPKVKGGRRENVIVPRSSDQAAFFAEIVERAQNIKPGGKDNMLAITTDARKAALDMRLISTGYGDAGAGKSDEAVSNLVRIWRKWEADRGTQLVFLDLSIPLSASKREGKALGDRLAKVTEARLKAQRLQDRKAPAGEIEAALLDVSELEEALAKDYTPDDLSAIRAAESGFSVYDDMKAKLIRAGVPEKQIAFIHDYGTDEKKADLFEQVNAGQIRILFGSTPKMGAGTNVQRRIVAIHHIDCPWRPSDIEQREGRGVRQGNELLEKYGDKFELEIYAYSTEQTYDARMWQSQELKLIGIEGLRNHKGADEMEEVAAAAASAAEMKAAATGNPLILEEVKLADNIRKLEAQQRNHRRSQYELEDRRNRAKRTLDELPSRLDAMDADAAAAKAYLDDPHAGNPPSGTVAGKTYTSFDEARAAAVAAVQEQTGGDTKARYSIEINGSQVTSQDAIGEALTERWGDPSPFKATVGRKTFSRRSQAARAIGEALAKDDSASGTIGGFHFSISVNRQTWHGKPNVETTLEGRTTLSDISTGDRDDKPDSLGRIAIRDMRDLLDRMQHQPEQARSSIAQAKKELPEIEAEAGKPWGKDDELARMKGRQAEVRRILASDDKKQSSTQAATKPDDDVPFQVKAGQAANGVLVQRMVVDLRDEMDRLGLKGVALTDGDGALVEGAAGAYLNRVIFVALDAPDKLATLRHEAIHAMYRLGMFRPGEWKALETMALEKWIDQFNIRQRWKGAAEQQVVEEAIAEAFANYMAGSYNPGGLVRRAFSTLRRLLARIKEFFAGEGATSWEQVFEAAARGDIGARDRGVRPQAREVDDAVAAMDRSAKGRQQAVDEVAFQVKDEESEKAAAEATAELDAEKKIRGAENLLVDDVNWFKRTVLHPRMIAAMEKAFVPVYRAAVRMTERRDEHAAELTTMAKPYFDLAPEKRGKVDAALELGRLQGVSRRSLTAITNDDNYEASLSRPGDTIALDADQQAAFASVRAAMDKALDEFKAQIIRDWDLDPVFIRSSRDVLHLIADDMPAEERRSLENLARILREVEQAKRSGYVPFTRWGQVGITVQVDGDVKTTTGEVPDKTIHFEKVELTDIPSSLRRSFGDKAKRLEAHKLMNIPEVKERVDALQKRFPKGRLRVFQTGTAGPLEDGIKMSDLDMLAEVAQLKDETWENIRNALSKAIQSTGFRKHFFGSQNVPGYSTDFERAIADYIIGISGYLARREFQKIFDRAIASIPDTQPKLREYSQRYRDYVNKPQEEFQNLRQFNFVWYLAGSLATALVNVSQVPLITAPYLSQFTSAARVGAELTKAGVEALKMATTKRGADMFDPSQAPADMRDDFQRAWDEGFFVPLNTWEVMGASQNRSKKLRGLSKKVRTAVDIVALMFSAAERFNRITTFIAAHRIAKLDGVKGRVRRVLGENNPLARSDELLRGFSPAKFSGWVIDETHYRMGKVNRPTVMRGAGAAILQFKGFMMQSLELMYRMAMQNGPAGMKGLGLIMLVLLLTSGLWGLPFADDLTDLIEAFIKKVWKVDKDLRTGFREAVVELTGSPRLAEALAKGLPRAAGLEVSARLGFGNIVPNDIDDGLGVPFDLFIGRLAQGMEYAGRGQWELAIGETMPNFIRNALHATSWGVSGVRSQATGKTVIPPEDVTVGDVAAKAVGFTPSRVANIREGEFAQQRASRASADQKREFYFKLARAGAAAERATQKGDADAHRSALEDMAEIYKELAEFNQDRPAHELVKIDKKTLQARIQEELIGAEARDKRAPKLSRGRREEIENIYGIKK